MKHVIGVTGGIASGKSNVCNVIKSLGYDVIDSDTISHDLSMKGNKGFDAIVKAFGEDYLTFDGELDRKKLGKLIFNDTKAKELLNSVTHPLIVDEIKRQIDSSKGDLVFVDIPLLYESKLEYLCTKIICVFLPKKYQVERLMERDGIDEDFALKKIHSQMDLYMKKELADYVIDSRGSFSETQNQILNLINELKENENGNN